MTGSKTFEGIGRESLEEHRQIHFYLDQIDRTLEQLGRGGKDDDSLQRLAAQIEGLKERLIEHQGVEEQGLFRAILDALPECRVELERLVNEHTKMIELLEMASIHAGRVSPDEGVSLRDDLDGFVDLFRRHESEEERLLRRALEKGASSTGA